MRAAILLPAALTALIAGGCGITDPYQQHAPAGTSTVTSTATNAPQATTRTDDPSDRPAGNYPPVQITLGATGQAAVPLGEPTSQAALERYARLDTNWSAQTLRQTRRTLAAISLGSARANALQAAASYGRDTVLLHSQVRNTGTVIAIAPDQAGPAGRWVIVTRETTVGQGDYAGLPPALHVVYAQVIHTRSGWVVSEWAPQN
jgi:hypothetical protein